MTELDEKKPFITHLEELRGRLFICGIVLVAFTLIGYSIHTEIIEILIKPLGVSLIYTSPSGALDFVLRISIIFGFLCSTPILLYNIIRFIAPAISLTSIRKILLFIIFSIILLIAGILFAYYITLPSALYFLGEFGNGELNPLISTGEYLDFVSVYLLGFGLIFQIPLVMLFVNSFRSLSIKKLFKYSKFLILFSFIFAAILTPTPDVVNQLLMAVPLILLYLLSVGVIWVVNRNNKT